MAPADVSQRKDSLDVLIVDDNPGDREYVRRVLENDRSLDCHFRLCESPREAQETYTDHSIDLIVLDYQFPQTDGIEFYNKLKRTAQQPLPPSLLTTAYGNPQLVDRWKRLGGDAYLAKDKLGPNSLHSIVSDLVRDGSRNRTGAVVNESGEYNVDFFREFLDSILNEVLEEADENRTCYLFFLHINGLYEALQQSLSQESALVENFVNHFVLEESEEWVFGHFRGDAVWSAALCTEQWEDVNEPASVVTEEVDEWLENRKNPTLGNGFSLSCVSIEDGQRSKEACLDNIKELVARSTMTPGTSVLIHSDM